MVRKLVEGRIVFTPNRDARRYNFPATGTLANFFSGIVCPQAVASPRDCLRRTLPAESAGRCGGRPKECGVPTRHRVLYLEGPIAA